MASSNRDYNDGIIVRGLAEIKVGNRQIKEEVIAVDVRYDNPAEPAGPGYAHVTVTREHLILKEDADKLLRDALTT
ncbi:hypothetical protein [Curtobacterium sp. MCJR17_020]|uniref:hypothetical protein n=1 Tax=Curtobacterium sp. MCJR17_020 TaxID=2175619 RepID=UPI000DA80C04|nr:hypothetical protein [Curtobacterium sp. MCJR17_020]WIE70798.1 hypothetical protein DEJ14_011325 [Curtobacterium sp. MCJR17_020]